MIPLAFFLSAAVVIAGGVLVAEFGDIIAVRTGLGRFLFGTLLLAAATSLTEIIAAFDAVRLGLPDLATGNMLGSSMTNMLFLGLLDLASRQGRLLRGVAVTHSLTAALATLLTAWTIAFILAPLNAQVAGIDLEAVILLLFFIGGVRLIQLAGRALPVPPLAEIPPEVPSLPWAILGFLVAALMLIIATPVLVFAAAGIATETGLGTGLIGVILLPLVTAMPELVSSLAALRLGAFDLAAGNLFGSTVFNLFTLALVSLFFPGSLFATVLPGFAIVGLLSLILINVALLGTLVRREVRGRRIEWDALLIIVIYVAGVYLLYSRGILAQGR